MYWLIVVSMRGLMALAAASYAVQNGGQQSNGSRRRHPLRACAPFTAHQQQNQQQSQQQTTAGAAVQADAAAWPTVPGFVQSPLYQGCRSNDVVVEEIQQGVSKLPPKRPRIKATLTTEEKKLSEEERQQLKDDLFRKEFLDNRLLLDETNPEHMLIRQGLTSVSSRTFRGYASHYDVMAKGGCNILNPRQVNLFQAQHKDSCQGSINSWVGAVELFQGAYGVHDPAAARQRRLAARGRKTMIPVRTHKPRGVIDKSKLEQLRKHALFKGNHYADGTVLQWAFGLRSGQVSSITANEIHFEASTGLYQYVSFRRKMRGGKGAHPSETEIHDCDPTCVEQVRGILAAAQKDPTRQKYLIPGWISRIANQKVKKAAKELDWGELLN